MSAPAFNEAGHGELAVHLGARADGVGDDEGLEALRLKVDRGLQHANMGLNSSDHDLGPALPAKLMQPLAQGLAPQAGEFDLVDDEAGIGEGFADRIDRRAQPLRILLGEGDRDVEHSRRAHEPDAALDHAVLAGDRVEQLVLDVDDEELGLVAGEQHGGCNVAGFARCGKASR